MDRPAAMTAALALVFNALVWGVSWLPLRWLQERGLHPLWATVIVFGSVVLLISLLRPRAWGELLRTPVLWVLVLASGVTNAAYNWAVTLTDVVRVVLLCYLMPLWAVLFARLLLGEALTPRALLRVAMALAGAIIVLWPSGGGLPLPQNLGEALGLISGISFALNNTMLRREARRSSEARALAMFLGGVLVAGALALVMSLQPNAAVPFPGPPITPWLAGVALLALVILGSNLALQYGAARLPAGVTAVVMVTEVLFAGVSAVLLGAGTLTVPLLVGGGLIVAAAVLAARG